MEKRDYSPAEKQAAQEKLVISREQINAITYVLVDLLCQRLKLTEEIGDAKKVLEILVYDKQREIEVLRIVARCAIDNGVPVGTILTQFRFIMCTSRLHQKVNPRPHPTIGYVGCQICRSRSPGIKIEGENGLCCPDCKMPTLTVL